MKHAKRRKKSKSYHVRGDQQPHYVILPMPVAEQPEVSGEPPRPSPIDHIMAVQQRAALSGRRRLPGMPNVRRVKIPHMMPDGSVLWNDV